MSSKTLRLIAVVAAVAVIFSMLNTYLILDSLNVREQLDSQQNRIDELETSLEQYDAQNQLIAGLQSTLAAQDERINELQIALNNATATINQVGDQSGQIASLQDELAETKDDLTEIASALNTLSTQLNSLNQSTSSRLSDLDSTIEDIEELISEISGLEELINELNNPTPAEVYETVHTSVVMIVTPVGQGSGFLFDDRNTIVTNYHVVEDETDIEIQFFDKTRTQATIIGSDPYADIAVLHVNSSPSDAVTLTLSDQSVGIGQQVIAIGNPLGLTESLSVGYISQVNRLLDLEPIIVPVYQLDLTIAPGSSGGPLLDLDGNVIGITNAGTDVGFNFAVPVDIMKRVIPSLISEGEYKHPLVGFSIVQLTPELIEDQNIVNVDSSQTGLLVVEVAENYPAAQAGITPAVIGTQSITAMDIVLAVDGHSTLTLEDWTAYMEVEVSPNQAITMTLWRSGVISSITLTTAERPDYQP